MPKVYADTVFKNAKVHTMEAPEEVFEEVAVRAGEIAALGPAGSISEYIGPHTKVIDGKGRVILPGFIESHTHPLDFGITQLEVDCRPKTTPTVRELLEKIKEVAAEKPKGEWIIGWGWDASLMEDKRMATREELDRVAPDHPVFLKRTDLHNAMVNSRALEVSGIDESTVEREGARFQRDKESGRLTGFVMEDALTMLAIPPYNIEDLMKAWELAEEQFLKWGITSVHDMAVGKNELAVYQQMLREQKLNIRVRMWLWGRTQMGRTGIQDELLNIGLQSGFGNERLNVQGMKYMLDGTIGGKTAAVSEAFENDPDNFGILYMSQEEINERVALSIEHGYRVSIHAIGDVAIEMALQAFEASTFEKPKHNLLNRHRIEHVTLPTKDQLQRIKKLGIVAASSIAFLYNIGDSYIDSLGLEKVGKTFPHQKFKEMGIVAPGHSDLPITEGNPMFGIYAAVTRTTQTGIETSRQEALSVYDAIQAFTLDAAYIGYEEHLTGSLKVGKQADLVMLKEDPFSVNEQDLKDILVDLTMIQGEICYQNE